MNIVQHGGEVRLTIVNGGASALPEKAESPTPVPDEAGLAHSARISEVCAEWDIPEWEGLTYVSRLEAFVGRRLDWDEMDALLARVCLIKDDYLDLQKMLAGTVVVVPMDSVGRAHRLIDTTGEGNSPGWRADVLSEFEGRRTKSA